MNYLKKYLNSNYNYALNLFASKYIYTLYNRWDPSYSGKSFYDCYGFDVPEIKLEGSSSYCSCCGGNSSSHYKSDSSCIKAINDWIHSLKKGRLDKIPKYDVSAQDNALSYPFQM